MYEDDEDDEDTPRSAGCPFCEEKECKVHLIACFDASGDEGKLGVGLVSGPLCNVNEIEEVLQRARLAWVQSVRASAKPKAPQWSMKERGLQSYFDALGDAGFDLEKYKSDEEAVSDLPANTNNEIWHAREEFLWEGLSRCGWHGEKTEQPFDSIPGTSTTYLCWWATQPARDCRKFQGETPRDPVGRHRTLKANSRQGWTFGRSEGDYVGTELTNHGLYSL